MKKQNAAIRILILNDHGVMRELWPQIMTLPPTITIVGDSCNNCEAGKLLCTLKPDVILMDIHDSYRQDIEVARSIQSDNNHPSQIVAFSNHTDRLFVLEAIRAGIVGFLDKNSTAQQMYAAITAAAQHRFYFADPRCAAYPQDFQDGSVIPSTYRSLLSKNELEILHLLAEGSNTNEIAFALGISVKTAKLHCFKIMKKLNIYNLDELSRFAEREGLCLQ